MRVDQEREPSPSEAIIESLSVKSAAMVSKAVGFDAGKLTFVTQTVFDGGYVGLSAAGVGDSGERRRA